jgi:hypothetical protein
LTIFYPNLEGTNDELDKMRLRLEKFLYKEAILMKKYEITDEEILENFEISANEVIDKINWELMK